ncbi:sporulation and cell division protein SsgA [Tamaricihabitans halophyticus]|uniref:Sporulation and cell division protein SsgA n=1 Tax=Tamaricihabitans halophyticus TaxID=1262583 RepID=A0A4R2R5B6_9PSEU|nr:SsgA family sporulation/cell division regulator [Tamaricihabitans halophyticus]TCP56979.1 sporulation and cell division protein SsgA [Tamaricihabitans halophyticus]
MRPTVEFHTILVARIDDTHHRVRVAVCYDSRDPWAVLLRIYAGRPRASRFRDWVFSRELLAAGVLAAPPSMCGEGDVVLVGDGDGALRIVLHGHGGSTVLVFDHNELAALAGRIAALAPTSPTVGEVDLAQAGEDITVLVGDR